MLIVYIITVEVTKVVHICLENFQKSIINFQKGCVFENLELDN